MIRYSDRSTWAWRDGAVRFMLTYDRVEVRAVVSVTYLKAKFGPHPDGDMLPVALDHADDIEDSVGRLASLGSPLQTDEEIRL